MQIVVTSNNQKKRKEIEAILSALGIDLLPATETTFVDVNEDTDTFAGNAEKKARAFAEANRLPALADDSGLCVDALGSAPGVYSARYAGPEASDTDNNDKLLTELGSEANRQAHFVCAICLAFPKGGETIRAEGQVDGEIMLQPSGSGGFGYDPLFFSPELGKCFAEASAEEKASVSHRGRALRQLAEQLKNLV